MLFLSPLPSPSQNTDFFGFRPIYWDAFDFFHGWGACIGFYAPGLGAGWMPERWCAAAWLPVVGNRRAWEQGAFVGQGLHPAPVVTVDKFWLFNGFCRPCGFSRCKTWVLSTKHRWWERFGLLPEEQYPLLSAQWQGDGVLLSSEFQQIVS